MKGKPSFQQRTISGFMWKFCEKICSQSMSLVVQIILARLLLPEEYGIVGYMVLFMTLADVFLLQGFSTALIQKKDADQTDYSSVFFANLFMAFIIYGVFFFAAPIVAVYYDEAILTPVMRVMSLTVIIGAFSSVHNAILARNMDFKKSFFRGLGYAFAYSFVGIYMAYNHFGVWSLVYAKLAGVFFGGVVLWIAVKWKPQCVFSFGRIWRMFEYSSKVLLTNLLNTLFNNISSVIIGRFYTSADMGYYQRGENLPQSMIQSVDGTLSEVMYPAFSILQSDIDKLKSTLRRSMKTSTFIVFPMLIGLMVLSKPIIIFLFTEKWTDSVIYMQLTCLLCLFWPLSARIHAINAIGKSSIPLKISLISKCFTLIVLLTVARFGVVYILYGNILSSFFSFIVTSVYSERYLDYSLGELTSDLLPNLLLAIIMGIIVYFFSCIEESNMFIIFLSVSIGVFVYITGAFVTKNDSVFFLIDILKQRLNR
ncbi:MAG: lipopolysaccharide biosynthesis protein [Acetatifactor sp.]